MEANAGALQASNVIEDAPIYDTVQIRADATAEEGYISFPALAGVDEIPFFTRRKRDIGIAYTNRDSNEALEYAYFLKMIHCGFVPSLAPTPACVVAAEADPVGEHNPLSSAFWMALMDHCGLVLKIREDEKLTASVPLVPLGGGIFGFNNPGVANLGSNSLNNGWPHVSNGFKFSGDGIEIPRGATFSVRLRFSTYAKAALKCLPGPGVFKFNDCSQSGEPLAYGPDCEVKGCALIRVNLLGWRAVQQRGQLHV